MFVKFISVEQRREPLDMSCTRPESSGKRVLYRSSGELAVDDGGMTLVLVMGVFNIEGMGRSAQMLGVLCIF